MLSTIFVLVTGLTVALIVFTPLKLYIPGYGNVNTTKELRELKIKSDSLEKAVIDKDRYLLNIKNVLEGKTGELILDTTMLDEPPAEEIEE